MFIKNASHIYKSVQILSVQHDALFQVNSSVVSTTEVKYRALAGGKGETNPNSSKTLYVLCNENHFSLFNRGTINKISNKFILAMRHRESGKVMKKLALTTRMMGEKVWTQP